MANAMFAVYRNNVLSVQSGFAAIDLANDTITAMLIDEGTDTPNVSTDQDLADIAAGARVVALASCPDLATKTIGSVATGVFDAADSTFSSVTGSSAESLILLKDTATEATSMLLAYWDTATGLPVTPNGGDINVTWNASGIFKV